jgi:GTPase
MTKQTVKSGYVAVVGRPNVGKSTLVNYLVGEKVSIVTSKPQTTQINVLGIVNYENTQIVLIDTPGLLSDNTKKLNLKRLNKEPSLALSMADLVVMLVEVNQWKKADQYLLDNIEETGLKKILVVNKVDRFKDKTKILDFLASSNERSTFEEIIPLSALRGKNINNLLVSIERYLPYQSPEFSSDTKTDKDINFRIAETMREKLMSCLREELPYSLICEVDSMKEKKGTVFIEISICVKKSAHRKIIIGKKGHILKKVGTETRLEVEEMLKKKVFLSSQVRVNEKMKISN